MLSLRVQCVLILALNESPSEKEGKLETSQPEGRGTQPPQ